MPTPANRAKIQLVRGSYSNIAASIADLVDGELCYAKDQNKLYMVEGTTLTPIEVDIEQVEQAIAGILAGGTGITVTHDDGGDTITIDLADTAVTAGSYGSSTAIPAITVDAQGRITAVTTNSISTDLEISADGGSNETITLGSEVLAITGDTGITTTTTTNGVSIDLDDTAVTPGIYGDASNVSQITVDQQGRITGATDVAISATGISDLDDKIREVAGTDQTFEPMGHAVRTDSTISFDASSRTFSIAPVGASYDIWCKGIKYTKTGTDTVTIDNTTGLYYIYFDSTGALQFRTSYFDWDDDVPTSYIYWNATTGAAPYFADERHGIALDWATHEYLHRTRGAVIANGFSVSNYTLTGDGSANAHAQIDLSGGTFFDEDLEVTVTHSNTPTANSWEQDLQGPAKLPVYYLSGTAWVKDTATDFPLKQGTLRPQYNLLTGGTWSTVDSTANKFTTNFVIATHNLNEPIIVILGQDQYNNLGDAEAVDWGDLSLPGFPSVEFRPLYKLIFETNSFTNTPNARLRSIIDIRQLESGGVGQAIGTDHGALSGLGDDDHLQYLHTTENRTSVTANIETSGTLKTTNSTASTSTSTGALVVAGGAGIAGDVYIGGDFTVQGTTTTIETETLVVEDKNIELGSVASPTNVTADGGGISLLGDTTKTINWVSSTDAWTFSEHIDLAATKQYYLNGTMVLGYDGSDRVLDNVIIDGGTY